MKGTVSRISRRGLVAIKTEDEDFSIVEVDTDAFDIDDEVFWKDATALGSGHVTNRTQREKVEVFFQNHNVSLEDLDRLLG